MAEPGHLQPAGVDLDGLSVALSDQGGWEHFWLFDPRTGQTEFWSCDDPELDGALDDDADDVRLRVRPLPTWVWYQDMVDFTELVGDERTARRLARALDGRGAFRRFKNELEDEYPHLLTVWYAFRDARAEVRAVEWLYDNELVSYEQFQEFSQEHPDPPVP